MTDGSSRPPSHASPAGARAYPLVPEPPTWRRLFRLAAWPLRFVSRVLRGIRRLALDLVTLAVVASCAVGMCRAAPSLPPKSALLVRFGATLVESRTIDRAFAFAEPILGDSGGETVVSEVVRAIDHAANDPKIEALVLDLDALEEAGPTKTRDVAAAITRFRDSDKPVIATAQSYSQPAYYIAAHASEVLLHPLGGVELTGMGRYELYFGEAIEKLGISLHVFRVGAFKSAVEPFLRSNMSDEARAANLAYLGDLWDRYVVEVAHARGLSAFEIDGWAQDPTPSLKVHGGDSAQAALAARLVDKLATPDEVRARLIELVGADETKVHDEDPYRHVHHEAYARLAGLENLNLSKEPYVGILTLRGAIMDDGSTPGTIDPSTATAALRRAAADENLAALVLRLDTPGGSVLGSELIRREVDELRKKGKKVVVSMGSLTASGGYWISTAADELVAYPTTLTGSIGIFGLVPTFETPLARHLHLYGDGVGTAPSAGANPFMPLPTVVERAIDLRIRHGYDRFIGLVAAARKLTPAQVEEVAQGRIWSGEDALERKLVDHLGDLRFAVRRAAELAGLDPQTAPSRNLKAEASWEHQLRHALRGGQLSALAPLAPLVDALFGQAPPARSPIGLEFDTGLGGAVRLESRALRVLRSLDARDGTYAHALVPWD